MLFLALGVQLPNLAFAEVPHACHEAKSHAEDSTTDEHRDCGSAKHCATSHACCQSIPVKPEGEFVEPFPLESTSEFMKYSFFLSFVVLDGPFQPPETA